MPPPWFDFNFSNAAGEPDSGNAGRQLREVWCVNVAVAIRDAFKCILQFTVQVHIFGDAFDLHHGIPDRKRAS